MLPNQHPNPLPNQHLFPLQRLKVLLFPLPLPLQHLHHHQLTPTSMIETPRHTPTSMLIRVAPILPNTMTRVLLTPISMPTKELSGKTNIVGGMTRLKPK